jgi:hypothetical protein
VITQRKSTAAWLLGTALALGLPVAAGPGPMQVEEPVSKAAQPPIQPEKDQAGWKAGKSASLTASQKAALKARQETMKDMVALIQQKRRAIKEARPEERQALALELHNLILEQTQAADRGRGKSRKDSQRAGKPVSDPSDLDANARVRNSNLDQKTRSLEHKEEILRQQELHRQLIEEKLKALEGKSGKQED